MCRRSGVQNSKLTKTGIPVDKSPLAAAPLRHGGTRTIGHGYSCCNAILAYLTPSRTVSRVRSHAMHTLPMQPSQTPPGLEGKDALPRVV